MNTVQQIYDILQKKAPFQYQLGFDNAGFLVGRSSAPVDSVLIALDITKAVAEEAVEMGAQLIVSHHPVIWDGVKRLTDNTPGGDLLLYLAEHGIAAICAHTNLDAVADGVNDALACALGLTDVEQLSQDGVDEQGQPFGIGRVGQVSPQSVDTFAAAVKDRLGAACVRVVDSGIPVHRVAVGGGSCGSMLENVLAAGCDTFVTADVKYDVFLAAQAHGLNLLDAGHYPTENVVCPVLERWLKEAFSDLKVSISSRHKEVYHCI
ncbi:Nif3-like dinuclear metal center hexameric protein [Pseudoflavonifractor capillosus]|uniref:Nif3-like dinuclear metal center hexameric protein n=1 Tax=Pseudoflavonifractor capillosus TaxID=106588 RepID=UPI00195A8B27|nr:Nif3-like dinuclear metal center hexameric protein [Pseudoflavonifractor capillosus]MBM6896403.1 Nif3-like dinuclear metal center hexameric protein [Pseudoflavonifractor capillosus]